MSVVIPVISQSNNQLGAVFLVGQIVMSLVLASMVKVLQPDFSVFVILFFRYLFCLPLLVAYAIFTRGAQFLNITNIQGLALRTGFGLLGLTMWFLSIIYLDISLATALSQTMPIFITGLSVLIAGEKVGLKRSASVFVGFLGVVVLIFPLTPTVNLLGVFYALLGAFFSALMFVYLRVLGRTDPAVTTAIWYNSTGVVLAGIIAFSFDDFDAIQQLSSLTPLYLLIALGVCASFQQFFLAQSHMYAQASMLAPLHFLAIPLGIGIGIMFFNESITLKFLMGTAIIIASTYYIVMREQAK
ncbi:DMT family transporter [Oceanospirillaceae bacterium]|jgi:drug/metabolite transporter (DMT)-like permease|nr:DMT family transporter [Oceanospirillaceae bacterium]MBT4998350.1 DMT family transporter [Oceanospirillaceae bacterium]MBT5629817.1 DMT family transporter [Oceanospirillaceae bacterium]MBT6101342.1 DMT family transporter [Oceanospirillaceae bacterium]MDB9904952.1 DMT family transporter [Oceanospirillaceae bacterium]